MNTSMRRTWYEQDDKVVRGHLLAKSLIDLAVSRGANIDSVLCGTGIFYDDLNDRDYLVSSRQFFGLIENIQHHLSEHNLSFLFGRFLFINSESDVKQLLANANNIGSFIRILKCYSTQIFPLLYFTERIYQDKTYLTFNSAVLENKTLRFLIESTFSSISSLCKWRFGKAIPLHFYFPYEQPKNSYEYEENLGHRLHFDSHLHMICLGNEWLYAPITNNTHPSSNKDCIAAYRKKRKQLLFNHGLLHHMALYFQQNNHANLIDAAEFMHVSPATLKRKLRQHGTSFQRIQDKVRRDQAVFDLKVRRQDNQNVAKGLNFNDLTNFRRAFKRWTGLTPSDLKQ